MDERARLVLADRQTTLDELNAQLQEYEAHITDLESRISSADGQEVSEINAQILAIKEDRKSLKRRISIIQHKLDDDNKLVETYENFEVELEEKTKELEALQIHKKRYSKKQNEEVDKTVQKRIERLERDVFNCSNRIRSYKNSGAYQQEALESKMYYELVGEIAKLKQMTRNEYRIELLEKELLYIKSEMKKISIHFTRSRLSTEKEKSEPRQTGEEETRKTGESNKRNNGDTEGKANNDLPKKEDQNNIQNRGEIIYMEDLRIEIARLQEEVRRSREREAQLRDEQLAMTDANTAEQRNAVRQNIEREVSERNSLETRIADMQRLDRSIERSAEEMRRFRDAGAYDQEASEHAYYNQLVEQAQRFIRLNPNPVTRTNNNDRENNDGAGNRGTGNGTSERVINETRDADGIITREIEITTVTLEQVDQVIEEPDASVTPIYINNAIAKAAKERGLKPEDFTPGPVTPGDDTERDGNGDDNTLNYIGIFKKNEKKEIVKKRFKEIEKEIEVEEEVEHLEEVDRVIEESYASITQMYIDKAIAKAAKERGLKPEDFTPGPVTPGDDTERDGNGDDNTLNYIGIFLKTKKLEKVKKMVKELEEIPDGPIPPRPTPNPDPKPVPPAPTPDRTTPEPNNLPVRSFWEIYNDTCTEHIGGLGMFLYNMSHAPVWANPKDDVGSLVANGFMIIPKSIIKGVSALAYGITYPFHRTGRKIEAMQERIEQLSDAEFEVLVSSPSQMARTFGNRDLKADLDVDFLGPQFNKQNKVNDGYLIAASPRFERTRRAAIEATNARITTLEQENRDLDRRVANGETLTAAEQDQYVANSRTISALKERGKEISDSLKTFKIGREEKTSSFKNIRGWFLAAFNPDNRNYNAEMAKLSEARREAIAEGNLYGASQLDTRMKNLSRSESRVLFDGTRMAIDIGKTSIESHVETTDRGKNTRGRDILSGAALMGAAANLTIQAIKTMEVNDAIAAHNQDIATANAQNANLHVSGQAQVGKLQGQDQAMESLAKMQTEHVQTHAEIQNLAQNNWALGSQGYKAGDAITHATAAQCKQQVDHFISIGRPDLALQESQKFLAGVANNPAAQNGVQTYVQTHPFDYTAWDYNLGPDSKNVTDFMTGLSAQTVPFSATVSGNMVNALAGIERGIDPLAAILASANAMHIYRKDAKEKTPERFIHKDENRRQREEQQNERDDH